MFQSTLVRTHLLAHGEQAYVIGDIVPGNGQVLCVGDVAYR